MKHLTKIILVVVTAGLIIYDIFVECSAGDPSTISRVILAFSLNHYSIVLLTGVLVVHLFFPVAGKAEWLIEISALILLIVLAVMDVFYSTPKFLAAHPFVVLCFGGCVGRFLLPQHPDIDV